jgi:hypothetical protein
MAQAHHVCSENSVGYSGTPIQKIEVLDKWSAQKTNLVLENNIHLFYLLKSGVQILLRMFWTTHLL